ncbi:MAG: hypothetical protein Q7S50_01125 [bacterium]|nr:hypothetical protein [bacterium]
MSLNKKLFASVSAVPSLSVALANMLPANRLAHVLTITKGLPCVEGLTDERIDLEIERHIGFIFDAIDDMSEISETERVLRFEKAMELARWYMRNESAAKIPKSMAKLLGEAASQWSTEPNEDEAQKLLKKIADFYLNSTMKEVSDITRSAINRACANCSLERLASSLITLNDIRTWNFGESIFDSIAIGLVRKQILVSPASIVRAANINLVVGNTFSEAAEGALINKAIRIAQIDQAARSFIGHLEVNGNSRWSLENIDEASNTATIACVEGQRKADVPRIIEGALEYAQDWDNPYQGLVTIVLKASLRPEFGVFERKAVISGSQPSHRG